LNLATTFGGDFICGVNPGAWHPVPLPEANIPKSSAIYIIFPEFSSIKYLLGTL
jgi:hypothetical protein